MAPHAPAALTCPIGATPGGRAGGERGGRVTPTPPIHKHAITEVFLQQRRDKAPAPPRPHRGYLPAPRPDSQGVREGAESRGHGRQPPPGAVHAAVAVAAAGGRAGRGGRSAAGPGPAPQAPGDEAEQSEAPHRRAPASLLRLGSARPAALRRRSPRTEPRHGLAEKCR